MNGEMGIRFLWGLVNNQIAVVKYAAQGGIRCVGLHEIQLPVI